MREFNFYDADGNLITTGTLNTTTDGSTEIGRDFDGRIVASVSPTARQLKIEADAAELETLRNKPAIELFDMTETERTTLITRYNELRG